MITYNNKNILKFFIGNKRVVKKYLNNKIVYGIPDFAQYYNIQGYDNYEVVGSPTITEGMVSNFSRINYITVPAFSPSDNTWKIVTKFKLTDTTTNQIIFSNNYQPNKQIQLSVQNSKLKVYISTNGTSSNLASGVFGTYTILIDTVYWVKFEFTGSAYVISYSVDGITWTPDIIINSTETLINVSNNMFFGKNTNPNYPEPLTNGSIIYLNDTYIEVNGNYWFNGNSNYKELLDCNPNVYIQSTGTQYIDTGLLLDETDNKMLYQIKFTNTNSRQIMGSYAGGAGYWGIKANGNFDVGYEEYNFGTTPYQKNLIEVDYYDNGSQKIKMVVGGVEHERSGTYTYTSSDMWWLFQLKRYTNLAVKAYLYSFKWYIHDRLVQHLVPVPEGLQIGSYKVPSNGMFDIITQTFYENKGSGEFIWGVDL